MEEVEIKFNQFIEPYKEQILTEELNKYKVSYLQGYLDGIESKKQ